MNKCKQCEYEWYGRKEKPISCPKCKRYDWNEVKEVARETQEAQRDEMNRK